MKNVAIIGASGFIGSYLVNNLDLRPKSLYNIIPVSRKTHKISSCKEVKEFLETNNIHTVVNCAFHGSSVIPTDIKHNLDLFLNFYNNSNLFEHYINVGSGAELMVSDRPRKEEDITDYWDVEEDDYSFTKNVIARLCLEKDNFTTLRLFGCFDRTEPDHRLFKKFINKEVNALSNIMFDYISAKDFASIVRFYIEDYGSYAGYYALHEDINCVYNPKYSLQNIAEYFFKVNNIEKYNYRVQNMCEPNYIGDGSKLHSLPIKLEGLWEGLKNYV
tara:strand:- start:31 stop:852 length:822 start_codon:yes stop_codon:yes gene_type:complete